MRPILVFLESNTTGTGRLFVRAARDEGCVPVLLTKRPALYPFAVEESVRILEVDTANENKVVEVVRRLSAEAPLAGLTSTSDYYISTAAKLAALFGLPGPSPAAITDCRDKEKQWHRLHTAGVRVPATKAARCSAAACEAAVDIGFPIVVKPATGSGSVGVRLCHSEAESLEHAQRLLEQTTNERGMAITPTVLLQQFVDGPEYSVESLDGRVIGVTEKHVSPPPVFVETGHDFPANLPDEQAGLIRECVCRALKALDLEWGAAHTELRLSDGEPTIIEVNPRLAGGFIPELVRRATGMDLVSGLIRRVVGRAPRVVKERDHHASIRFLVPPRSGTVQAVHGLDAAGSIEGVCDLSLYRPPGFEIRLAGDFHDRIGHLMTSGPTARTARATAARALELLSLSIA